MSRSPGQAKIPKLVQTALSLAHRHGIEEKLLFAFTERATVELAQRLPALTTSQARIVYDIGVTLEEVAGTSFLSHLRDATRILEEAIADDGDVGWWSKGKIVYYLGRALLSITGNAALNSVSAYRSQIDKRQPYKHAKDLCLTYVSLGTLPFPSFYSHPAYKDVVNDVLQKRAASGFRMKLISWTINDEDLLRWLAAQPVDGIITDKPGLLKTITG